MPFSVRPSGGGFKVFSPSGAKSKRPMSKARAQAQQRAIYANYHPAGGVPAYRGPGRRKR